jgi:hypothetical protein
MPIISAANRLFRVVGGDRYGDENGVCIMGVPVNGCNKNERTGRAGDLKTSSGMGHPGACHSPDRGGMHVVSHHCYPVL